MGDAVVLLLLGGAVLLAVVVKGFSFLQRKLAPVIEVWEGDIVAAIIRFEQHPHNPGALTPQTADVVIRRRADGDEHVSFIGGVDSLPDSVREQIFGTPIHSDGTRHGGFRFALERPIAVQVEENDRGSLQWRPLR